MKDKLIAELREWQYRYHYEPLTPAPMLMKQFDEILSRHEAEEANEKPSAPACGACIPLKKECENCERMRPSAPASLVEELEYALKISSEVNLKLIAKIRSLSRPSKTEDIAGHDKPSIPTDKTTGIDEMKFKAE